MGIDRPLRVFVAGLAHETNSFSPLPTSMRNFEDDVCYRPPLEKGRAAALEFPGYGDALAVARQAGDEVVEGPCFWTQPSGPVSAPVYAELRDAILESLRLAGPVDLVILNLHGAMLAQGTDDPEADVLAQVRSVVGPDVPVGALLDLHGNVSLAMIESGAVLVGVKEYPHTDYRERAVELHALLCEAAPGDVSFASTLRTIPSLSLQGTTEAPMRELVAYLQSLEQAQGSGIRSVTLMHGFPWADWEATGGSVIVVSQDLSPAEADAVADDIAARFRAIVTGAPVERLVVVEAVGDALASAPGNGPVVIADSSDNPGGGAACDSTYLLHELVARDCRNAALGMIWDPQAARLAADAGVGARLMLRIGGKVGPLSGPPVDLEAQVLCVREDACQCFFSDVPSAPLGLAVALRVGGIEIVVNSIRQQVFSPECFTQMGIDPASKDIVVVKSSQHFRARFDPLARRTIYCNAPGSLNVDLAQMPYRRLRLIVGNSAFAIDRPVIRAHWPDVTEKEGNTV
ncbi:M81 family metallopeptidase [Novosphingobium sp. 1949]|uniref:Microcystinase C n=1 Tax=Novosphingobium organovorum TaxID=2930092 RepID=A0ABT0BGL7_9SPHN|nr:M81 family metallopeptidase [Novosphingobium organovorum]MCJ2184103.1 M81 family metallopeptidase [Novosphingobium organovorum]